MANENKVLQIKFTKEQLHQLSELLLMPIPDHFFMSIKAGTYNYANATLFDDRLELRDKCIKSIEFFGTDSEEAFQKKIAFFKASVKKSTQHRVYGTKKEGVKHD